MKKVNWDEVKESTGGFASPKAGGYIARITNVEDNENREYLRIEWDFDEGEFAGANQETYNRAGFWPTALYRSYKPKALPFFKAFKTAVEESNRGYVFREDCLTDLRGKLIGIVLGEEEYKKAGGNVGTRVYVAETRSVKRIREGDFKVPAFKELGNAKKPTFTELPEDDEDGELPF